MTLTLTIETSCDETAIAIVDFKNKNKFKVLSELILSQIDIHKEYGGVYPAIAKREHLNNLFPIFIQSLDEAGFLEERSKKKEIEKELKNKITEILDRDDSNLNLLINFYENYKIPKIKLAMATYGPGLEIALWTGFNFTKALAVLMGTEFVGVNHMEGHLFSSLLKLPAKKEDFYEVCKIDYPSLGLLISGGHTELVLIKKDLSYEIIGKTLDDAAGEAYDKSARLLGIDYPGGPQISKLAQSFEAKYKGGAEKLSSNKTKKATVKLPRPMLQKNNFDFSFSGLKTAVLYIVRKEEKDKGKKVNKIFKEKLAAEFEDSVSEVLYKKSKKAIEKYNIKNFLIGGGVSANKRIRKDLKSFEETHKIKVFFPDKKYTGDNALMISVAGFNNWKNQKTKKQYSKVDGNLKLE